MSHQIFGHFLTIFYFSLPFLGTKTDQKIKKIGQLSSQTDRLDGFSSNNFGKLIFQPKTGQFYTFWLNRGNRCPPVTPTPT
jgi:hypothetical protein